MEVLQEVYFGKTPLIPIQKQFSKVRHKLINKPVNSTTNIDPDIIKFNRMVENFFGFKSFSLYIQPNEMPNAYAIPIDIYLTDEQKRMVYNAVVASPTGFKYEKAFTEVSLVIAIHSGLLNAPYITDEEVMATILHEIGHGFFEAITDKDGEYTIARKLSGLFQMITSLALEKVKAGKEVSEKIIDKEIDKFDSITSNIKNALFSMKSIFVKESMDDNMVRNRIEYTNEKFADTFAAMYGYGEECHSGDVKTFQNVIRDRNGITKYNRLQEILKMYKMYIKDLFRYTFNIQDEHPAELARMKTTADYIKKELQREGLDPKLKRELVAELDKVQLLIKEYIEYPKDEDSMRILRLYHIKLYEKFGGDRRERDTDNDALFDAIDARYNDLDKRKK